MRIVRTLHRVPADLRGAAVTIGNFDGVHLGHQRVMRQLVDEAGRRGIRPLVMVFEPQPQEYFTPYKAPARLTTLREKIVALGNCGIGDLLCLRFGRAVAEIEAEEFVRRFLVDALGARLVIVGDDFRFGRGRRGDFALLASMGRKHGYDLVDMETFTVQGRRVSSSWIRELLAAGDVEAAMRLLGRPYGITGRVVRGEGVGRTLGFPTANIDVHERVPPLRGIYAVRVLGLNAGPISGVASIGTRPVFAGTRLLLEVFLFDWEAEIYGRRITVEFHCHLRPERNFASVEELRTQMRRDEEQARALLAAG
jgi:riboflavin kinase/FMN adenylyltransferase